MMQYHIKPQSLGRSKPTQRLAVLGVLLMGLMGVGSPAMAAGELWGTLVDICGDVPQGKDIDKKIRNACIKELIQLASIEPVEIANNADGGICNLSKPLDRIDKCRSQLLVAFNKSTVKPSKQGVTDRVCQTATVVQEKKTHCESKIKDLPDSLFLASNPLAAPSPETPRSEGSESHATDKDKDSIAKSIDPELHKYIDEAVQRASADEKNWLSWLSLVISLFTLGVVFYSRHTQTYADNPQSTGQSDPISQIPQKPTTQPNQNLGFSLGQQQQISLLIEEQLKLQQRELFVKSKQETASKPQAVQAPDPIMTADTFKVEQPEIILTAKQPPPVQQPPEQLAKADLQQLLSLYQTWAKDSRGMISLKDWLPPPINEKLERLGYQICCWKAGREVDLMIVDTSPPTATKAVGIIRIQDKQGYAYCLTKTHSVAQIWQAQTWYKVTQQGEQLQQIAEITV